MHSFWLFVVGSLSQFGLPTVQEEIISQVMRAVQRKEAKPVRNLAEGNSEFPSVGSTFLEKERKKKEKEKKIEASCPFKNGGPARANNAIGCTRQRGRARGVGRGVLPPTARRRWQDGRG